MTMNYSVRLILFTSLLVVGFSKDLPKCESIPCAFCLNERVQDECADKCGSCSSDSATTEAATTTESAEETTVAPFISQTFLPLNLNPSPVDDGAGANVVLPVYVYKKPVPVAPTNTEPFFPDNSVLIRDLIAAAQAAAADSAAPDGEPATEANEATTTAATTEATTTEKDAWDAEGTYIPENVPDQSGGEGPEGEVWQVPPEFQTGGDASDNSPDDGTDDPDRVPPSDDEYGDDEDEPSAAEAGTTTAAASEEATEATEQTTKATEASPSGSGGGKSDEKSKDKSTPKSEKSAKADKSEKSDESEEDSAPAGKRLTPDERLMRCCEKNSRIQPSCYRACKYSAFTRSTLESAFLNRWCPIESLGAILFCVNRKNDARDCCSSKSVPGLCSPFCAPGQVALSADPSFLPCLDQLAPIKQCFYEFDVANPVFE